MDYDPRATQLLRSSLGALLAKSDLPLKDGRYSKAEYEWRLALERGADPHILITPEIPAVHLGADDHRLLACLVEHGASLDDQIRSGGLRFTTYLLKRWRERCLTNPDAKLQKLIDQNVVEVMKIVLTQPVELERTHNGPLSFLHSLMWQAPTKDRAVELMEDLIHLGVPFCEDVVGDAPYRKDTHPKTDAMVQKYHLKNILEETASQSRAAHTRKI